jgi:hypothetical protein
MGLVGRRGGSFLLELHTRNPSFASTRAPWQVFGLTEVSFPKPFSFHGGEVLLNDEPRIVRPFLRDSHVDLNQATRVCNACGSAKAPIHPTSFEQSSMTENMTQQHIREPRREEIL